MTGDMFVALFIITCALSLIISMLNTLHIDIRRTEHKVEKIIDLLDGDE